MGLRSIDKQVVWKDDSTCIMRSDSLDKTQLKLYLSKRADIVAVNPIYSIDTGLEMGVTDEILVKFNDNVPKDVIEKLHKQYGVVVLKTTNLYQLLRVPVGQDALSIANLYQESGFVRFSTPNFLCDMELHHIPNDPYFVNQYSLNNTGQVFNDGHSGTVDADIDAPEAWDITRGNESIIIAVLDQGLTSNHPDLPNSRQIRLAGSNFGDGDPNNPSPVANDNHGNACAGIIAATQDNNEGIAGIAPNCKIMPVRIFNAGGNGITPQRTADAIEFAWQNGAQIISNSWGYNSNDPNFLPVVRDAIQNATTQGRNGLGSIVVFSAGNNMENSGFVHFPSNVNVPGVMTVGASDRFNLKSFYSPVGNPTSPNNQFIDIVAPSHRAYSCQIAGETFEAWSIDIPGDAGDNSWHVDASCSNPPAVGEILPNTGTNFDSYTGRFGGTSYSCPQVAAVAALVLSINPLLTQQQVFDVIISTADKVGGYVYTNGRSNELGFGKLNASAAVNAILPTISGLSQVCDQATYTVNVAGATVVWSATPSGVVSLQPNGNSVTLTKVSGGKVTLSATINNSFTVTKDIWVGNETAMIGVFDSNTGNMLGAPYYLSKQYNIRALLSNAPASSNSYRWQVTSPLEDDNIMIYRGQSFAFGAGVEGYYHFTLQYLLECGWSTVSKDIYFGNRISSFSLYPNPATNIVTLQLIKEEALEIVSQTSIVGADFDVQQVGSVREAFPKPIVTTSDYEVQFWNEYSGLVHSVKSKESNLQISLKTLPKGMYFVHFIKKGEKTQKQILWVK